MTKKFTEEQYQKIVEIGDDFEENGGLGILDTLNQKTIGDVLFLTELAIQIEFYPNKEIIAAIANPLTREWAHEQYVEKEKKYVWSLKVDSEFCLFNDGIVVNLGMHNQSKLTESEVKEWGYNQEMFDREEV